MDIALEIDDLKYDVETIGKRIAIFYEDYNRQIKIIQIKKKLAKGDNLKHILNFEKDLKDMKKMFDFLTDCFNQKRHGKKFSFLAKTKMVGRFTLLLRKSAQLNSKYKKENCNIDNFEV